MKTYLMSVLRIMSKLLRRVGFHKISVLRRVHLYILERITPEVMTVKVNGCLMELHRSLGSVSAAIGYERRYEEMSSRVFSSLLLDVREGCVVVDVGANIGYYTLLAAKLMGDKGLVYSIEPEPVNYKNLVRNVELNNMANVVTLNIAAGEVEGIATLYLSESSGSHSTIFSRGGDCGAIEVPIKPLDSVIPSRVDVIKIDTEGADLRVLRGAEKIITTYHPTILVECWEEGLIKAGGGIEALWDFLQGHNYHDITMADEAKVVLISKNITPGFIREYTNAHLYTGQNLICK